MNQEDWKELKTFTIDLAKFSPIGLGYWFLCHNEIIPEKYKLPFALIGGYILGMTVAMLENFLSQRKR